MNDGGQNGWGKGGGRGEEGAVRQATEDREKGRERKKGRERRTGSAGRGARPQETVAAMTTAVHLLLRRPNFLNRGTR